MFNTGIKKGAMFGLDARIALIIFGALSLISGASLFSAIEKSKVTTFIYDMKEISKAVEAFYLDVGILPGLTGSVGSTNEIRSRELSDIRGLPGWAGPYLLYDLDGIHYVYPGTGGKIEFAYMPNNGWKNKTDRSGQYCENNPTVHCHFYIGIYNVTDEMKKTVDRELDGSAKGYAGKVRYADGTGNALWYHVMPDPNFVK